MAQCELLLTAPIEICVLNYLLTYLSNMFRINSCIPQIIWQWFPNCWFVIGSIHVFVWSLQQLTGLVYQVWLNVTRFTPEFQ